MDNLFAGRSYVPNKIIQWTMLNPRFVGSFITTTFLWWIRMGPDSGLFEKTVVC